MMLFDRGQDWIDVRFTPEEFGLIGNALNEVCNGVQIGDFEFQTRLGSEKNMARTLLAEISKAYTEAAEAEKWPR